MLNRPHWRTSTPIYGTDDEGTVVSVEVMILEWRKRFGIALRLGEKGTPIVFSPGHAATLSWSLAEAAAAEVRGQLLTANRSVSVTITPQEFDVLQLETSDGGLAILATEARRAFVEGMRQAIVERAVLESGRR